MGRKIIGINLGSTTLKYVKIVDGGMESEIINHKGQQPNWPPERQTRCRGGA